jgi:translation initiation factor 2A
MEAPSNPNEKLENVINQKNNVKSGIKEQQLSATALKNKKKREAKKAGTADEPSQPVKSEPVNNGTSVAAPMSDIEKEIKKLQKKLDAINKLKAKVEGGATLEVNQIEKLKSESGLIEQMKQLQSS